MADRGLEQRRRLDLWAALARSGGPTGVKPALLHELGIYGGAQGVWYDSKVTKGLGGGRVGAAVGVLHTGHYYADDLDGGGCIYHYPSTTRRGKDEAEIKALRTTYDLRLPIFVITPQR